MTIHTVFKFRNHALMMALAAAFPVVSYAAGAARVDFSVGPVSAVNVAGTHRTIGKGGELGSGELIVTGDGGRAQLRFSDGGMVSLQPGSEFKVDDYSFSGKAEEDKGFFSLLKGAMRTITGLVGRSNKNAYRVTTSVATIGIRGTEFTVAYTGANSIAVSTGEGMIEVCNNAGCALIPAGSSAIVAGPNTEVRRSDIKPRLDPAQPDMVQVVTYSTSDDRYPDGKVNLQDLTGTNPSSLKKTAVVSTPLVSGAGYALAYAGHNGSSSEYGLDTSGTASFDSANALTSFIGSGSYSKTVSAGAFSADGVIGWGRWSSGTSSSGSLIDFHYAVGKPSSTPDLVALGGINADYTYNLIGYTLPTAQNGTVGQAPSGSLSANFRDAFGVSTVSINLTVPIGGSTFSIVGSQAYVSSSMPQTFTVNTACATVNGFFAGSNATHAGVAYKLDSGGGMGDVHGSAAFKR
ncbi:MAG: FecR domain-containing protein [Zoogloeaceae bacterium]|nr:FecR domain-containing protein [Zoogloeaceae bacterium]